VELSYGDSDCRDHPDGHLVLVGAKATYCRLDGRRREIERIWRTSSHGV